VFAAPATNSVMESETISTTFSRTPSVAMADVLIASKT
jgi:hypothetical protein